MATSLFTYTTATGPSKEVVEKDLMKLLRVEIGEVMKEFKEGQTDEFLQALTCPVPEKLSAVWLASKDVKILNDGLFTNTSRSAHGPHLPGAPKYFVAQIRRAEDSWLKSENTSF